MLVRFKCFTKEVQLKEREKMTEEIKIQYIFDVIFWIIGTFAKWDNIFFLIFFELTKIEVKNGYSDSGN